MKSIYSSLKFFLFIPLWFCMQNVQAALDIELTKGVDGAIPIAIVPFANTAAAPVDVASIIRADLANSGRFRSLHPDQMASKPTQIGEVDLQMWRNLNVDDVVIGKIEPISGGQYRVSFSLVDLYKTGKQPAVAGKSVPASPVLLSQEFVVNAKDIRRVAHHISDMVYQQLTGEKGVFSTRLAYITVQHLPNNQPSQYHLVVSDMDGHNAIPILRSQEPIMSASWSPDGQKIAYVSFESKRPKIYISEVVTGKRQLVTSFPGINGAPAWSPDGRKLAVALSSGRNPNIFVIDLSSKRLEQVTNDLAINTEPHWARDGQSLVFTSDRGGSPQIYSVDIASRKIDRLTFNGNYNASASYTPDGKSLVLLHRDASSRGFTIALMEIASGAMRELTSPGMNESPSVAPNGRMVVYATQNGQNNVLGMVSTDGRVRLRLPDQQGSVQEPVWSPYL